MKGDYSLSDFKKKKQKSRKFSKKQLSDRLRNFDCKHLYEPMRTEQVFFNRFSSIRNTKLMHFIA